MARKPKCLCGICDYCARQARFRRYEAKNRKKRAADARAKREAEPTYNAEAKKRYRVRRGQAVDNADQRARRAKNPEKFRARDAVKLALRKGILIKGPCEMKSKNCRGQVQAHHDDYSKPLEVRWLCTQHHADVHRMEHV